MTKLRSIAVVAVLGAALLASSAQAQDGGWNTKYGMIFTVQNVFDNGSAAELGDLGGSVGLQYNLSPQRALRFQVKLSRASNTDWVSEDTLSSGGVSVTTKTFHAPGSDTATTEDDFSSKYDVGLGAAYMMRLTADALAPYLGAGAGISFGQTSMAYKDDVDPANVTEVDNVMRTMGLGAEGILGIEWRVQKSISLFAEYALDFTIVNRESVSDETTVTTPVGSATGTTEYTKTTFLNFDTGIGQSGLIGLVAYF